MAKIIKKTSLILIKIIKITLNNPIQNIKKVNLYKYIKRLQNLLEHKAQEIN
jgi:hypothetical protein